MYRQMVLLIDGEINFSSVRQKLKKCSLKNYSVPLMYHKDSYSKKKNGPCAERFNIRLLGVTH